MTKVVEERVGDADYTAAGSSRARSSGGSQAFYDFLVEVAKGSVAGHSLVHKFGSNPDVDTATTPEDVWQSGGLMHWPTAAGTLDVVSSSANDDGNPTTSSGAQTIVLEGLDADFEEISEEVTLNGTTAVTTTASFSRLNRAYVTSVGTYHGSNEGALTITTTVGANVMATIPIGYGQTQLARYTVPAGYTAYFLFGHAYVDARSTKAADVQFRMMPNADDVTQPYGGCQRNIIDQAGLIGASNRLHQAVQIPEKTDVWATVVGVDANDTAIDVEFQLLLVANP